MATDPAFLLGDEPAPEPPGMDDRELASLLDDLSREAVGYLNSEIAAQQEEALKRYYGLPLDNEEDGRSKVVDRLTAIVVDNALAAVMRPFVSGEHVVRFEPTGPEDEDLADEKTEYVNHILMVDNPGFQLLHDWFKDALLLKLGVVKAYWLDKTGPRRERRTVDAMQLEAMLADGVQIVDGPEPVHDGLFAVVVEEEYQDGCVRIEGVPTEEFLVSPRARSVDESPYVGHRVRKTRSELISMGADPDVVNGLPAHTEPNTTDGRDWMRYRDEQGWYAGATGVADKSQEYLLVYHEFPLVDVDGDGIAERLEVIRVDREILWKAEVEDHPFATLCPKPMPHKVYGLSMADDVVDIERVNTALLRAALDNLYLTNNPRPVVALDYATERTVDDLLNFAPGAPIEVQRPEALGSFTVPFTAERSFGMMEWQDRRATARTGVSLVGQGMDPDAIRREMTATEAALMDEGRNARLEMVARIFAETGVKTLFRKILRLVVRHQPRARIVRIRNRWVSVDPSAWNIEADLSIATGIGVGSKATRVTNAQSALQLLERLALSPYGSMVKPEGVRRVVADMLTALGYQAPEAILADPREQEQAAPAPDPAAMEAMAKQQQAAADMQLKQAEMAARMELEREKATAQAEIDRAKMEAEVAMKAEQQRFEAEMAIRRQDTERALAERKMEIELELARERMAMQAATERAAEAPTITGLRPGGDIDK